MPPQLSALRDRAIGAVPPSLRKRIAMVTSVGWFVMALGAVSWFVGWQLGWQELMWFAAACLIVTVLAVAFVFGQSVVQVTVAVDPQRVVVGERAAGRLDIANVAQRRLLALQMELTVGSRVATFDVPSLGPGEHHEELFVLPTTRRTIIPIGPAASVRSDPIGVLRRAVRWTDPTPLYVHPRTLTFDRIGAGFLRDLEGQPTNELSQSDVAFHALREYQSGDDRRHIHWRTYARVGTLMVRQFVDSRRSHLAVVLSGHAADYASGDEFELAVSIAGSLALRSLRDEQQVSMAAAGTSIPALSPTLMLDGLAGIEIGQPGADLVSQSTRLNRSVSGVSLVALVTGSTQTMADIRTAALRFPPDVRIIVMRADVEGRSGFRPVGSYVALNVATLDELPKLLWAAARS